MNDVELKVCFLTGRMSCKTLLSNYVNELALFTPKLSNLKLRNMCHCSDIIR